MDQEHLPPLLASISSFSSQGMHEYLRGISRISLLKDSTRQQQQQQHINKVTKWKTRSIMMHNVRISLDTFRHIAFGVKRIKSISVVDNNQHHCKYISIYIPSHSTSMQSRIKSMRRSLYAYTHTNHTKSKQGSSMFS